MTAAEKIATLIASLTVEQIADVMVGLVNNLTAEADVVWDAAMSAAQDRMSSGEFLAMCGRLEEDAK